MKEDEVSEKKTETKTVNKYELPELDEESFLRLRSAMLQGAKDVDALIKLGRGTKC